RINRRPGGRRSGRPPFFDRTGVSCRKIPTRVGMRGRFGLSRPFLLVTFLLARKEKLPGRRRRTEALLVPDMRKARHARLSGKVDSDPCFSVKRTLPLLQGIRTAASTVDPEGGGQDAR